MYMIIGVSILCFWALWWWGVGVLWSALITAIIVHFVYPELVLFLLDMEVFVFLLKQKIGAVYEDLLFDDTKYEGHLKGEGDHTIYGEITLMGMRKIVREAKRVGVTGVFIDLGCGVGKSLVLAKGLGMKTVVGVEIVEGRYKKAMAMREKLPVGMKEDMHVVCGDAFSGETEIPFIGSGERVIIFASNLLWSDEMNERLYELFLSKCYKGSLMVCSSYYKKEKGAGDWVLRDIPGIRMVKKILVPMSWELMSECYLLEKVD